MQSEISSKKPESHYGDDYFRWQNASADIGAKINSAKFLPFVRRDATLLDFGCGGGTLASLLPARERIGIEINPTASAHAKGLGLDVKERLDEIDDQTIDIVVSNHALEHVEWPLKTMQELHRVLKPGGTAVIVVPCDRADYRYDPNDKDFHLHSWSAGNLGNLARAAGFQVVAVEELKHKWPPRWQLVYKLLGERGFHLTSRVWSRFQRNRRQVRLIARR